jgi:cell division protease FtsH
LICQNTIFVILFLDNNDNMKNGKFGSFFRAILIGLLILMVITGLYSLLAESSKPTEQISLSQLVSDINNEQVSKITVKGDDLEIIYKGGAQKTAKKESETALTQTLANYGVSKDALNQVAVDIQEPSSLLYWLGNILPFAIPLLIIVVFFWLAGRQVKNANLQAFSFGQSRARMVSPEDRKERITFKDVAGVKEAKEDLQEIVEFLKNPKKFSERVFPREFY